MTFNAAGPQFLKSTAVPILGCAMPEQRINCNQVVKRLSDFLNGDLEPGDHQEVEGHLRECNSCSQTFEELRLTISLLGRLPKYKR